MSTQRKYRTYTIDVGEHSNTGSENHYYHYAIYSNELHDSVKTENPYGKYCKFFKTTEDAFENAQRKIDRRIIWLRKDIKERIKLSEETSKIINKI